VFFNSEMMYSNNFAAALLVDGKVLREFGDIVYLPFGSEYAIRLKNLNNTRALVHIEIDGQKVTDSGLVVDAYKTSDLERFIRNGNLKTGNRFKFIERSQKVEEHRGIGVEDGIISIRYEFESSAVPYVHIAATPSVYRDYSPKTFYAKGCSSGDLVGGASMDSFMGATLNSVQCSSNTSATSYSVPANETGITVEGSVSKQSFSSTYWKGTQGPTHALNIRLLGETADNQKVREPVTVKTKIECKTCGTVNPATAKFCSECGTSLSIV
jgi:hypothetical protein